MDNVQKNQFEERLRRIAKGGPNTLGCVYIGPAIDPDVEKHRAKAAGKAHSGAAQMASNALYPLSFVGAFLMGAIAVMISRYARFHLMGGELTGELADVWMVVDGVIATAVVIALSSLTSFSGTVAKTARTAGIVAMVGLMHNFVHVAPAQFAKVYSPEWVSMVVATTEPKSFLFRGASFVIGDPAPSETPDELPRVFTLNQPAGDPPKGVQISVD